jgi:hypothetical protein
VNSRNRERWLWVVATLGLIVAATALRFHLNFATAYPPARDAAYYPLQTLYWFAHGRFMYDDLPLIFWLNIGLTKIVLWTGQPLNAAALLASRILDCILEPWTAAAIMAAGYSWSQGQKRALIGAIAASILVLASRPVLQMLSEFQKNSLGFVWMACSIWACRRALLRPTRSRWLFLAGLLLLSALTHIGAFGVTALSVGVAMIAWVWRQRRYDALLFIIGFAAILMALLYVFDSHRAVAVLRAPLDVFTAGSLSWPPWPELLVELFVIVYGFRRLRRDRSEMHAADIATITALIAVTAFLALPKAGEYSGRLALMGIVPVAFLVAFITARGAVTKTSLLPEFLLLIMLLLLSPPPIRAIQQPFMNESAAAELLQFRQQIDASEATLVVAPHGLEWWAGYFLGTPVRMKKPDVPSTRYRRVLLLRDTAAFPLPGMPDHISPQPIGPPAQSVFAGRFIEVYEIPNGQ